MKELILGGARSGKSRLAEDKALAAGLAVTCIVTAQPGDAEMAQRIRRHRERRPPHWAVVEAPVSLAAALKSLAAPDRCLLVDCLTIWLSNLLHLCPDTSGEPESAMARECRALLETLPALAGHIILVSNEVGMGIVPSGELSRRFRDEIGRLHQDLAARCDHVILVVAGLPLTLKGNAA